MKIKKECCRREPVPMDAYIITESIVGDFEHLPVSKKPILIIRAKWQAVCPNCGKLHSGPIAHRLETREDFLWVLNHHIEDKTKECGVKEFRDGWSL